ncbi:MAG: tetratricopeptide repeat protein [Elusimicrobiales bacterium]
MKKIAIIIFIAFSLLSLLYLYSQTDIEKKEEYIKAVKQKIEQIKSTLPSIKNPLKQYIQIAHLYIDIEDYDSAEEYFKKAIMLDAENPNIYYMLAMLYEKKNDRTKAIESWRNVIRYSKNKKIIEIAEKHIEILLSGLESAQK